MYSESWPRWFSFNNTHIILNTVPFFRRWLRLKNIKKASRHELLTTREKASPRLVILVRVFSSDLPKTIVFAFSFYNILNKLTFTWSNIYAIPNSWYYWSVTSDEEYIIEHHFRTLHYESLHIHLSPSRYNICFQCQNVMNYFSNFYVGESNSSL